MERSIQGEVSEQTSLMGPRCMPFWQVPFQFFITVSTSILEIASKLGSWSNPRESKEGGVGGSSLWQVTYSEGEIRQCNPISGNRTHARPILIQVQTIGVLPPDEVLHQHVLNISTATVRLDHHHLIRGLGVDVSVYDVGDGGACPERTYSAAARPIAVNALDKEVCRRVFDGDAFIFVRYHYLHQISLR